MFKLVPPGTIYPVDEPEHFGRIPAGVKPKILSADNPNGKKIGFTVTETVGIGVYGSRAILPTACPVCGEKVLDLLEHANGMDDLSHEILSVMMT